MAETTLHVSILDALGDDAITSSLPARMTPGGTGPHSGGNLCAHAPGAHQPRGHVLGDALQIYSHALRGLRTQHALVENITIHGVARP